MTIFPNFPLISQQTTISADGSSPNAEQDCVPTSILAGLMYLNGIREMSAEWNPDKLLDMAYPEGYRGGTAASAFVEAAAKLGCTLTACNGIPGVLVQRIHAELALGHPVIVTVPDSYVPASYGWTHVLCAYGDAPGYITMLDPWPGKPITKSDAEWQQLLLFNQIWILAKEEDMPKTIEITDPNVAHYFELANNEGTQWRSRVPVNGKQSIIQFGILDAYRKYGGDALCGLTYLGLPMSGEIPLPGIPGAVKQVFERGVLVYDPAHKLDNPPGSGPVYAAHLYNGGPGQDPRVAALQGQVTQLQQQAGTGTADEALVAQIRKLVG